MATFMDRVQLSQGYRVDGIRLSPHIFVILSEKLTQPAFTCSKLRMKTLEKGVKYVQS